MSFDAAAHLKAIAALPDRDIDPAVVAVALAALDMKGLSPGRYISHLGKIAQDVSARYVALIGEGAQDDCAVRLAALKHVIVDQYGYREESDGPEPMESANLIRTIDRRKGLPVCLALLYSHAARAQGWDVCVLRFPCRRVCRIEWEGVRLIFDPAAGCRILQAPDLRAIVKAHEGNHAELSAAYYEPLSSRALLICLQNYIKLRQIEVGDYADALMTVRRMQEIDPQEYRLFLDAGVLLARNGDPVQAAGQLEEYVRRAPTGRDRDEAALLLRQIRDEIG